MAEVTARTGVPPDQRVESTGLNRVVEALRDQETFTRAQVAWLMGTAQRWGYDVGYDVGYDEGYEQGQRDELALATIADQYAYRGSPFNANITMRGIIAKARREEADAAAKLPRPGDYRPVDRGESGERRVAA